MVSVFRLHLKTATFGDFDFRRIWANFEKFGRFCPSWRGKVSKNVLDFQWPLKPHCFTIELQPLLLQNFQKTVPKLEKLFYGFFRSSQGHKLIIFESKLQDALESQMGCAASVGWVDGVEESTSTIDPPRGVRAVLRALTDHRDVVMCGISRNKPGGGRWRWSHAPPLRLWVLALLRSVFSRW